MADRYDQMASQLEGIQQTLQQLNELLAGRAADPYKSVLIDRENARALRDYLNEALEQPQNPQDVVSLEMENKTADIFKEMEREGYLTSTCTGRTP